MKYGMKSLGEGTGEGETTRQGAKKKNGRIKRERDAYEETSGENSI